MGPIDFCRMFHLLFSNTLLSYVWPHLLHFYCQKYSFHPFSMALERGRKEGGKGALYWVHTAMPVYCITSKWKQSYMLCHLWCDFFTNSYRLHQINCMSTINKERYAKWDFIITKMEFTENTTTAKFFSISLADLGHTEGRQRDIQCPSLLYASFVIRVILCASCHFKTDWQLKFYLIGNIRIKQVDFTNFFT